MNNNNYQMCCPECFDIIAKRHSNAAVMWLELCKISQDVGAFMTFDGDDIIELRILETLGFIVTTDSPTCIGLRIVGKNKGWDGEDLFCIHEGQHDNAA